MLSRHSTNNCVRAPQHRNRCYCQMRDKWCKSRDLDEPTNRHVTTAPRTPSNVRPVNNEQRIWGAALSVTAQRNAYENLLSNATLLSPTSELTIHPANSNQPSFNVSHERHEHLREIREYRSANPDSCCSSSSLSATTTTTRSSTSSVSSAHRCQVRYRLNERAQSIPCSVNADGQPLCAICCRAFALNESSPTLQFAGSSHRVCVLDRSQRTSQGNHRTMDYTKLLDQPSLILEIHDYGQSRTMELSNKRGRLVDISIANMMRPPNSLALRHQRKTHQWLRIRLHQSAYLPPRWDESPAVRRAAVRTSFSLRPCCRGADRAKWIRQMWRPRRDWPATRVPVNMNK